MEHAKPRFRLGDDAAKALKVLVPLATTVVLLAWLFHKVNYHQVLDIIHRGVDYRFIIAMMVVTCLSHIIRGIRWGIQLRAAGVPRMPVVAESVSIFGAYALNLVFPFLGEAWRCVYISRRENVKLSTVVGTDIGDRASDGIMIGLIVVLAVFVARPAMERFASEYRIGSILEDALSGVWLWVGLAALICVLLLLDYIFRRTAVVQGINTSCARIWNGFAVLFHLHGIGAYLWLTLGIWVCYFLETYLCFFAFPFTRELISQPGMCWGLVPGLVVFVFGSCSMIVPSNGGLGPWNIAVAFAMTLYGLSEAEGAAYSLICWSFQSLMLVICGIFSAIYITSYRKKRKRAEAKADESQVK